MVSIPILGTLVEITKVWICRDNGRHGRNVKAKETAANNGDGCDDVDVTNYVHLERCV